MQHTTLKMYKARALFILFIVSMIMLIGSIAVIASYWPKYEEKFFELGLLGENKTAERYFPGDNSYINVNTRIKWYVYVHNSMHSPQDVKIVVRLLNSTTQGPNDRYNIPSPFPSLITIPVTLDSDETYFLPFFWSISSFSKNNNIVKITDLVVNNIPLKTNVLSIPNTGFRMVFELWVLDRVSRQYQFGWDSGKGYFSASLSMMFDI